jgi:predicted nuclease of restriction endonuclease-like (RecB) superfamily
MAIKLSVTKSKKALVTDIKYLIEHSRNTLAVNINSNITLLNWQMGKRIHQEVLNYERAEYGKEIVKHLSTILTAEYGTGYAEKSLRHAVKLFQVFPSEKIVSTLSRQLTWSHLTVLLYIKESLKRDFYIEMCRVERWPVRLLRDKIDGMLYERTALSKKPAALIRKEINALKTEDKMSADLVFHDPVLLNQMGLSDLFSEKDLEGAIIRQLQQFIIEMGSDFAFICRQKRIVIDGEDYALDLLFYHRKMRRLVAIDLKLGKFKAAYKGQMELYLRWLEKNEWRPGEETPIGLILCAEKSSEHIELMQLQNSNIRVAEYMTELPSKTLLKKKLQRAITIAQQKIKSLGGNKK